MTTNERWEALHQRICAKEQAQPGRADVLLDAPSSLAILHAERVVSAGGMQEAGRRRGQKRTAPSRYTGNSTASWPQPQWNAHATACEAGLHRASLACDSQHKWLRRTGPDAQGAGEQQLRDEEVQAASEELAELERGGLRITRVLSASRVRPGRHDPLLPQPQESPWEPRLNGPAARNAAGHQLDDDGAQAALQELAELERCGLRVSWPS